MVLRLKQVNKEDWNFILEIRNLDEVRQACHDTSIISNSQHYQYMEKISNDPNCYHWIVLMDNTRIGHTKIILNEALNGVHEFGYMLVRKFRGKGLAKQIYESVFTEAKKLGIKKLHDTIKIEQEIPRIVALNVGFKDIEIIKKDGKHYAYSMIKEL